MRLINLATRSRSTAEFHWAKTRNVQRHFNWSQEMTRHALATLIGSHMRAPWTICQCEWSLENNTQWHETTTSGDHRSATAISIWTSRICQAQTATNTRQIVREEWMTTNHVLIRKLEQNFANTLAYTFVRLALNVFWTLVHTVLSIKNLTNSVDFWYFDCCHLLLLIKVKQCSFLNTWLHRGQLVFWAWFWFWYFWTPILK